MIECELDVQARFSNYKMVGVSIKFVRNTPVSPIYLTSVDKYYSRQFSWYLANNSSILRYADCELDSVKSIVY